MSAFGYHLEKSSYVKQFNAETKLWVPMQVVEGHRPSLALFPRLGFFNRKVTELLRTRLLMGQLVPPTMAWTLGYLMPEPRQTEWLFEPTQASIAASVETVVAALETYGTPAMTSYPNVKALLPWAEDPINVDRHAQVFQRELVRAIVYFLNDASAVALQIVNRTLDEGRSRNDLDDPSYAPYLRFRTLLGT